MASTPQTIAALAVDMPRRLVPFREERPWGRRLDALSGLPGPTLPPDTLIGEIHHRLPHVEDPELLVKTLFTGERLSVQVHPDAVAARRLGHRRGKDEAWVVVAAEPGAVIGMGLSVSTDAATLRAAALDGSVLDMMVWHPCRAGDVLFCPAGTIHAIGAGLTLIEVQQNLDLTFRLHDYGRGRELHLDQALAVADLGAWTAPAPSRRPGPGRELLVEGPGFMIERLAVDGHGVVAPAPGRPVWLVVIAGSVRCNGMPVQAGEVWFAEDAFEVSGSGELLAACPGGGPVPGLWRPR